MEDSGFKMSDPQITRIAQTIGGRGGICGENTKGCSAGL
jgi:hypothetical protein